MITVEPSHEYDLKETSEDQKCLSVNAMADICDPVSVLLENISKRRITTLAKLNVPQSHARSSPRHAGACLQRCDTDGDCRQLLDQTTQCIHKHFDLSTFILSTRVQYKCTFAERIVTDPCVAVFIPCSQIINNQQI